MSVIGFLLTFAIGMGMLLVPAYFIDPWDDLGARRSKAVADGVRRACGSVRRAWRHL